MENWKSLVGYQPLTMRDGKVDYILAQINKDGDLTFAVESASVPCDKTEAEVIETLDRIFSMFTTKVKNDEIKILRAKNEVARKSRRGMANTQWKNAIYYRQAPRDHWPASKMDAPVIVAEYEGKYGVFVHPKFDDYGFIVE